MTRISISEVRASFNQLQYQVSKLESLTFFKASHSIGSSKLRSAASRVNTPLPFKPFIDLIEKSLNVSFPTNLVFTPEEVRKRDVDQIAAYQVDFDALPNINFNYFLIASISAYKSLGLDRQDVFYLTSVEQSAASYVKSTSAGYPTFRKKGSDAAIKDATSFTNSFISSPSLSKIMKGCPCAVFHRYQYNIPVSETPKSTAPVYNKEVIQDGLSNIVKKSRQVWGESFRYLTLTAVYFRSFVDETTIWNRQQEVPTTTYGLTKSEISERIIRRLRSTKRDIISVDFSKFDSTVPRIFHIMFYALHLAHHSYMLCPKIISLITVHSIRTPFCYGSSELNFHKRGIASGELLTSLFGSFVNKTIINLAYLEVTNGKQTAESDAVSLGDDLTYLSGIVSLNHFRSLCTRLGMNVDLESCYTCHFDEPFPFLGYIWDRENRPTQLVQWYIAHFVIPSGFIRNRALPIKLLQTYRAISIAMQLYHGMDIYDKLIGYGDTVYKDILYEYKLNGKDPIIFYEGPDSRQVGIGFPLSTIFSIGWEAF
uniref:RdRp n=1 Tax=viral metagenome TaxID=1070528 RepID=A0A2V0R912_9ZZZZ